MLPEAYVIHQTPNRLRIKIPSKKGDVSFFSFLKDHLARYPGIEEVHVNPLTGSLLLLHRLEPALIAELQASNPLFQFQLSRRNHATLHEKIADSFSCLNDHLKVSTGGEVDIPSLALLGLLGMGLYELCMGNFLIPAWYTAFWYASSIIAGARSPKGNDRTEHTIGSLEEP